MFSAEGVWSAAGGGGAGAAPSPVGLDGGGDFSFGFGLFRIGFTALSKFWKSRRFYEPHTRGREAGEGRLVEKVNNMFYSFHTLHTLCTFDYIVTDTILICVAVAYSLS